MNKFFKGILLVCGLCFCITVGARGIDIHEVESAFTNSTSWSSLNDLLVDQKLDTFNVVVDETNKKFIINQGTTPFMTFDYVNNEYMLFQDNTEITQEVANNYSYFYQYIIINNLVESLFTAADHPNKVINSEINATFEDDTAYETYGILLNYEDKHFEIENGSLDVSYLRKFKASLISDKIDNLVALVGKDRPIDDGSPSVPSGLKPTITADDVQDTSLTIYSEMSAVSEGNSTSESTGYYCKIYRSTKKDSGFEPITEWEVGCDGVGYTDDTVKPSTTYFYKYQVVGGDDTNYSDVLEVTTKESLGEGVNVNLNVSKGGKNSLEISWDNKGEGVTYTLYRTDKKNQKKSKYKKIKTIKDNFYVDSKLKYGKTYYYYLVVDNGTNKLTTDVVSSKVIPNFIEGIKVVPTSDSTVKVTWNKSADAKGYQVRVTDNLDGKWKQYSAINGAKKTSFTANKLKANTTYYVQVRAYTKNKGSNKKQWGEYAYCEEVTTGPAKSSLTATSTNYDTITLTTKAVENATKYEIQRSTNAKKKFETIVTTTSTTHVDSGLKLGKKYYYRVRSCNDTVCSGWSKVVNKKPALNKPTFDFSYTDEGKKVVLVDKVDGAAKYEIQRSTSRKKGFKKVAFTKETSFIDSKAKTGKVYFYRVRAVSGKNKSGWSEVK